MSDNTLKNIGLAGAACVGGITGYLWATMLTTVGIAAVSNPGGIVCGALAFIGMVHDADSTQEE